MRKRAFMSISEYFNCSYEEEDVNIEKIAFHYYYNPSKWTREENTMSSILCDRIDNELPFNHVIERGIITSFSFFLDHKFLISNDGQLFPNQPGVPANWRNNINVFNGGRSRMAEYFMRLRSQTYGLSVAFSFETVTVKVTHLTVHHKPCIVDYRVADLLALSDAEHRMAYALHFVDICTKEFKNLVQKAVEDKPPTAQRTPLH